jgi:hypothetical protein
MKNIKFVLLFLCFYGQLFSQQLTETEKNKVYDVVSKYCKLLSDYTESRSNISNRDMIYELFPSGVGDVEKCVIDDIETLEMTHISRYLTTLTSENQLNYTVKIAYLENVYNVNVSGLSISNHREKLERITHGKIKLTKQMKGALEKTTNNVFHVKLDNSKIERIFIESQNETDNDNNNEYLIDKGMQAMASKRYAEALEYFEKSAKKGNFEAMYQAGYMYYAKKGCEKLSRTERNNRAYYWLSKAARRYSPHHKYRNDSPIMLARELLDRMGYYNE